MKEKEGKKGNKTKKGTKEKTRKRKMQREKKSKGKKHWENKVSLMFFFPLGVLGKQQQQGQQQKQ